MGEVFFFDSLSRPLLEALLNSFWQGVIITALVWLLLRFIRRVSATTRHAVWLVCLLAIGALPVIVLLSPLLQTDAITQPVKREHKAPSGQTDEPSLTSAANLRLIEETIAASPVVQAQAGGWRTRTDQVTERTSTNLIENSSKIVTLAESAKPAPAPSARSVQSTIGNPTEARSFRKRMEYWEAYFFSGRLPLAIICAWLAVCLMMMGRIARSYLSLLRLRRRFGFVPSEQRERVQRLAEIFGIRRSVRVFTSRLVSVPMTIGAFRPVIVLPPDLTRNFTMAEFESVIAHELAHIKRWDYLTNLLQRLVQALFFYHPAVWFIGKQMMIERELACDDWAVKTCEPRRYAGCLTKLVELVRESKTFAAAAGIIFGKHVISRRVEMILNRDRNATTAVSKPALVYAIGLALMLIGLCSMISPVIAVPLAQDRAERENGKETTTAQTKPRVAPPASASQASPVNQQDAPILTAQTGGLELPPLEPVAPEVEVSEFDEDLFPNPAIPAAAVVPAMLSQPVQFGILTGVRTDQDFERLLQDPVAPVKPVAPAAPVEPVDPVEPVPQPAPAPHPAPKPLRRAPFGFGEPGGISPGGQDDKDRKPTIPEGELLSVLTDIVKRDSDVSVRNEALQGIYRLRSDAAITALIDLYDGINDVKIRGEIIGYLLRRNGDNSKATAKLVRIAKSEPNEELRGKAIRYLGAIKGDEGANNLIEIYNGLQDAKMKQSAIRGLGVNRSRKAIDKLIQIAKNDPDPTIRQVAIRTLYGVDERYYLEFVEKRRPIKISRIGKEFQFDFPEFDGFRLDDKIWKDAFKDVEKSLKELQKNGVFDENMKNSLKESQKMIQENQEKINELMEKLRIEELDKLQIELPKIELHLKELENDIELGRTIRRRGLIERQLQQRVVQLGNQIESMRSRLGETHPKIATTRSMMNTLERHYEKLRTAQPRPARATAIRVAQKAPARAVRPARPVE
jgi:beta-lactamase regulating signal transducer with metallopeptidase domain